MIEITSARVSHNGIERLGLQLERLKRRCGRLHRRVRQLDGICDQICAGRTVEAFLPNGRPNPVFNQLRRGAGYGRGRTD